MSDDLSLQRAFRQLPPEERSPFADLQGILEALPEGAREQILAAFQRLAESRSATEAQAKYYQGRMLWAREALLRLFSVAKELEEPCDCQACTQCRLTQALDAADDALNHLPQH